VNNNSSAKMNPGVFPDNYEDLNSVFAVIVLYKTDLQSSASFNSLLKTAKNEDGVLEILLYNNYPQIILDIAPYKDQNIHISEINDEANSGVSKAYNIANSIAKSKKKKWLLLLDQDTELPADFFSVFFSERKQTKKDHKLYIPIIQSGNKIVSPANYFLYRGFLRKEVEEGELNLKRQAIINSGVIINTELFKQAGGYNENVSLDFSDVSFFRKVRKIYSTVFLLNIKCAHSFSGFEYDNYEKNFNRFRIYNTNAIAFSREKGVVKLLLFLQVFIRATHLSLKFKTLSFLQSIKFN